MRILKLFIWILILYAILPRQQFYLSSLEYKDTDKPKVEMVDGFLARYNSPLRLHAVSFVKAARENSLDYKLLPAVAMVESSGGKNYRYNAFGWGSDTLDFGDDRQDIFGVAGKIASLSYYQTYRKTGDLRDFCLAYNPRNAETYCGKLKYFLNNL